MKKFFLKKIFILVILLICTHFLITSSFFIKSVILPAISHSFGAKINVTSIEISPIRGQFSFDNLSIIQKDNFNANIAHFDTKLNIPDLLHSKLTVHYLNLENSYIKITQTAYSEQQKHVQENIQTGKDRKDTNTKICKLALKDIKIKNFNISYFLSRKSSQESSVSEIRDLSIDIPYFETNGKGTLSFYSEINTFSGGSSLSWTAQGKLDIVVNKDGIPQGFDLKAILKLEQDRTPISCKFDSTQRGKETPFTASLNINNLSLQPFSQTFIKGTYQKTKQEKSSYQ